MEDEEPPPCPRRILVRPCPAALVPRRLEFQPGTDGDPLSRLFLRAVRAGGEKRIADSPAARTARTDPVARRRWIRGEEGGSEVKTVDQR